jgi:hypothetical protein
MSEADQPRPTKPLTCLSEEQVRKIAEYLGQALHTMAGINHGAGVRVGFCVTVFDWQEEWEPGADVEAMTVSNLRSDAEERELFAQIFRQLNRNVKGDS